MRKAPPPEPSESEEETTTTTKKTTKVKKSSFHIFVYVIVIGFFFWAFEAMLGLSREFVALADRWWQNNIASMFDDDDDEIFIFIPIYKIFKRQFLICEIGQFKTEGCGEPFLGTCLFRGQDGYPKHVLRLTNLVSPPNPTICIMFKYFSD